MGARAGALAREADVFAYFNNDWEGFAPATLWGCASASAGKAAPKIHPKEGPAVLLILAIILLIIAIAGGVIVHPILFALAIVALVLFFTGRRGAAY